MVGGEDEGLALVLDFVAKAAGDDVIDLEGGDGGAADWDGGEVAGGPEALELIGGAALRMADRNVRPAGDNFRGREVGGHHAVVHRIVEVSDIGDLPGKQAVMLVQRVKELKRSVQVQVERVLFDIAEPGEGQADAVIQMFVAAEYMKIAIFQRAVLPAIDDGKREAANAGAGVEEEDIPFGSFHLDAGGVAFMVGERDGNTALDAPEGDAEAVHRMPGEARE